MQQIHNAQLTQFLFIDFIFESQITVQGANCFNDLAFIYEFLDDFFRNLQYIRAHNKCTIILIVIGQSTKCIEGICCQHNIIWKQFHALQNIKVELQCAKLILRSLRAADSAKKQSKGS